MLKHRSLSWVIGLGVLLTASLFSYSRTETFGGGSTKLSLDGAAMATFVLCVALFWVCRRIGRTLRLALARAGLPTKIAISPVYRWVIGLSLPFFMIGYRQSHTADRITEVFSFGSSPFKLSVLVLVILVTWLIALLQRLHELTETLPASTTPSKI